MNPNVLIQKFNLKKRDRDRFEEIIFLEKSIEKFQKMAGKVIKSQSFKISTNIERELYTKLRIADIVSANRDFFFICDLFIKDLPGYCILNGGNMICQVHEDNLRNLNQILIDYGFKDKKSLLGKLNEIWTGLVKLGTYAERPADKDEPEVYSFIFTLYE